MQGVTMKLLLEENNRIEVDRIRMLMESNGIPIFIGNEITARNFSFIPAVQKYCVWVCEDEQYESAAGLLQDGDYHVENSIDVESYYRANSADNIDVSGFIWKKILLPGLLGFVLLIGGVWALTVVV